MKHMQFDHLPVTRQFQVLQDYIKTRFISGAISGYSQWDDIAKKATLHGLSHAGFIQYVLLNQWDEVVEAVRQHDYQGSRIVVHEPHSGELLPKAMRGDNGIVEANCGVNEITN